MGEIRSGDGERGSALISREPQNTQNNSEGHRYAQKSLLLGVLSLFFFGIVLGPLAIINAKKAESLAVPAVAGKVLGWLGTAFGALAIIVFIVVAASISSMFAPLTAAQDSFVGIEQAEQLQQPAEAQPVVPTATPVDTPTGVPSSAPTPSSAPDPSIAQPASPFVVPVDSRMSASEAGRLFLDGVCPRNQVIFTLEDLVVAAETSGEPLDLAGAISLATEYRTTLNTTISLFGKTRAWPDGVQQDIDALLGEYVAQVLYSEDLMAQTSPENFVNAYYSGPDQTYSAELGGRIRASLGLNPDALASCGINR